METSASRLAPVTESVLGAMVEDCEWSLFHFSKGKFKDGSVKIQSSIKPMETSGGVFLSLPKHRGRMEKLMVSEDLKSGSILLGETLVSEVDISPTLHLACRYGTVFFV